MIRLVIFNGYGLDAKTNGMNQVIQQNKDDLSFVELRMKLAEYVEYMEVEIDKSQNLAKWLSENPESFVVIDKSDDAKNYACWDCVEKRVKTFSIVKVDESKKWGINEYDGAEGVVYLEPECVEEKYNYYRWDND